MVLDIYRVVVSVLKKQEKRDRTDANVAGGKVKGRKEVRVGVTGGKSITGTMTGRKRPERKEQRR